LINEFLEGQGDDQRRHRGLVNWVIRMRIEDRNRAHGFLERWQARHPWSNLKKDVMDQWSKGNRGEGWYE
jgi:hypothetical protein